MVLYYILGAYILKSTKHYRQFVYYICIYNNIQKHILFLYQIKTYK